MHDMLNRNFWGYFARGRAQQRPYGETRLNEARAAS
jgi:hypothetical protein